jgi:hypothetical protein
VSVRSTVSVDPEAEWRRLSRVTGVAGLLGTVLLLGPISAASGQEPGFTGDAAAVRTFFASVAGTGHQIGRALVTVGLIAVLWFSTGLALLLGRAEGSPPWRSAIAAMCAVPFVTVTMNGLWQAASFRAGSLDDPTALLAFDTGNVAFANVWVAMGSFAGCFGWVVLRTGFAPRWSGWLAVLAGVGLVGCRFVWTSSAWFFPYALFWLLVIAVSIRLLRRARPGRAQPTQPSPEKEEVR